MLTADGEEGAEVYAAAAIKDQAKILYRDAVNMVEQSEELQRDPAAEARREGDLQHRQPRIARLLQADQLGEARPRRQARALRAPG
jgi:hypothetical protein